MAPVGLAGAADERTTLAWRRTSLAVVVNGVLLVARHERALPWPWALVLGALATGAAAVSLLHGARRARGPVAEATARRTVLALGLCLTTLAGLTTAALLARWSA
ncbi:MAG: hypothetical protein JWR20_1185 [Marmoricola sp.]|nr:hypothetical protein [Marmoricola sp.]